jgi:hypothetical protein
MYPSLGRSEFISLSSDRSLALFRVVLHSWSVCRLLVKEPVYWTAAETKAGYQSESS